MEFNIALWKINPREIVKYINAFKNNQEVLFNPKVAKKMIDSFIIGNNLSEADAMKIIQDKFKELQDESFQRLIKALLDDSPRDIASIIEARYITKDTALMYCATYNSINIANYMLDNNADINFMDLSGWTPLIISMVNGYDKMFGFLINKGADINKRGDKFGITPLMIASIRGDLDKVVLLCNKGADLNLKMSDGFTALALAKKYNHLEIINYLQSKGAIE